MHILLTGGGTAGHVYPAIAIAEMFEKKHPDIQISFVGTPNGMENNLVDKKYTMHHINVKGFSRSLSPKNLYAAYLAWHSPQVARKLLRRLKPDLVVGTGGYVSWPILKAAGLEGIPCAVHESNAIPGLTVKKLEKYVDKILLNFDESKAYFAEKGKTVTVGNPLRRGFTSQKRDAVRASLGIGKDELLLLSFGGSLGATALNRACLHLASHYVRMHPNIHHIHGCGERNYDMCLKEFEKLLPSKEDTKRIELRSYIDNMPDLMQASDIIISRAGAMTLSEIALAGRASILIPSPNVTNNHQFKNAQVLSNANAAVLLEESDNLGFLLEEKVDALASNIHFRKTIAHHVAAYAKPDANERIYRELTALMAKK